MSAVVIARFSPLGATASLCGFLAVYGIAVFGAVRLHGGLLPAVLDGRAGALLAIALVAGVWMLPLLSGILVSLLFRGRAAVTISGGRIIYVSRWVFCVPLNQVRTIQARPSDASPWVGGRDVEIELVSGRRRILRTALLDGDPKDLPAEIADRLRKSL